MVTFNAKALVELEDAIAKIERDSNFEGLPSKPLYNGHVKSSFAQKVPRDALFHTKKLILAFKHGN
ncbi:MAG TPA: hypothetical protein VJJ82_05945 [Candidatus Nanoarchaeia archaeon]|nr:hypothetical protein [Candidatus Nanoarchaeia archaeon]